MKSPLSGEKRTQAYSSLAKQVVQSQFFDSLTVLMGTPPLLAEVFKAMLRGASDAWISWDNPGAPWAHVTVQSVGLKQVVSSRGIRVCFCFCFAS